jgi:hypothetical protein
MDELHRLTQDFDPDPERGLAATVRLARRRRAWRRTSSAVLSLGLFAGGLGLAWSQFRPGVTPIAGPSIGPSMLPAFPSPSASTYCRPVRVQPSPGAPPIPSDYCVTKTWATAEIARLEVDGTTYTLWGFPATFDGFTNRAPPGTPPRFERVRRASICLAWQPGNESISCHTGAERGAEVEPWLLDAPLDPSRALQDGDPFRHAVQEFGTTWGQETRIGVLVAKWTVPRTHRVEIRSEDQPIVRKLVEPIAALGTRWKLIIAVLPPNASTVYRAYDANGNLIWRQQAPALGVEP